MHAENDGHLPVKQLHYSFPWSCPRRWDCDFWCFCDIPLKKSYKLILHSCRSFRCWPLSHHLALIYTLQIIDIFKSSGRDGDISYFHIVRFSRILLILFYQSSFVQSRMNAIKLILLDNWVLVIFLSNYWNSIIAMRPLPQVPWIEGRLLKCNLQSPWNISEYLHPSVIRRFRSQQFWSAVRNP
jgi:hypothetical protein